MLEVIRASALQGFAECVGELGGDPEALLSAAAENTRGKIPGAPVWV